MGFGGKARAARHGKHCPSAHEAAMHHRWSLRVKARFAEDLRIALHVGRDDESMRRTLAGVVGMRGVFAEWRRMFPPPRRRSMSEIIHEQWDDFVARGYIETSARDLGLNPSVLITEVSSA